MKTEEMLELIIFKLIVDDYSDDSEYCQFLEENYNIRKMIDRYKELGDKFLKPYALNKTEKSD